MNENNEKIKKPQIAALPKNVRQIGEIDSGMRIYIEDYAYTYIHQIAINNKDEQIIFLIGSILKDTEEEIMLICGAIKGEYLDVIDGELEITNNSWSKVYELTEKYFSKYEIVGWAYIQPGYGILITSNLTKQHKSNFKKEENVLFVLDPIEKEEGFFQLKDDSLIQRQGFFIYYEKNTYMHEYMLENKAVEKNLSEPEVDKVIQTYRLKEREKKEEQYHKKFVYMLSSVCGALIIICTIICIGLINNIEEMNKMKQSFQNVIEDYSRLQQIYNNTENNKNKIKNNNEGQALQVNSNNTNEQDKDDSKDTLIEDKTDNNAQTKEAETINIVENSDLEFPESYIVQPGDNLTKISYKFYNNKEMVSTIQQLNNIKNPNKIYVGQKILLPKP